MIDFIKSLFNVGDTIYLDYGNEVEVSGKILNFGEAFIAIESSDGNIIGIKEDSINSFSKSPISSSQTISTAPYYRGLNRSTTSYDSSKYGGYGQEGQYSTQQKQRKVPFKYYKPGDKIPIDSLAKIDPSLTGAWKRSDEDRAKMSSRKEEIRNVYEMQKNSGNDLEQLIPAIGAIVDLKPSYKFGFIDDVETGERYFYNRGDIVDNNLKDTIGEEVKVVYFRGTNHKGPAAKCIFRPNTIGAILDIAMNLVEEDDFIRAKTVLRIILATYPNSLSAQAMLDEINKQTGGEAETENTFQNNALYTQAKNALDAKDYKEALALYQECIEKGIRKVNSIKELAQVYISLHSQEKDEEQKELYKKKGIEFIEAHKDELPNKLSSKFSLENIYFALGDYNKHIEVVEDIIAESGRIGNLAQYVFYLNKAAQSYLRLNEFERAMDTVNQGLEIEPDNVHLCKTKQSIEEAMSDRQQDEHGRKGNEKGGSIFRLFNR